MPKMNRKVFGKIGANNTNIVRIVFKLDNEPFCCHCPFQSSLSVDIAQTIENRPRFQTTQQNCASLRRKAIY